MRLLVLQRQRVGLSVRPLRVAPGHVHLWTVVMAAIHALLQLRQRVRPTVGTLPAVRTACQLERARTQCT